MLLARWKRWSLAGCALVALSALVALGALAAVAKRRGVTEVAIPSASLISGTLPGADYADAYEIKVRRDLIPEVATLARLAFQKAELAAGNHEEVMYVGGTSILTYHISYLLREADGLAAVTVSTTVHYVDWRGRLSFAFVRPIHRVLTPFLVSHMVERSREEVRRGAGVAAPPVGGQLGSQLRSG